RRHTRSKRDWSSDVCSSDLVVTAEIVARACGRQTVTQATDVIVVADLEVGIRIAAVPVVAERGVGIQLAAPASERLAQGQREPVALVQQAARHDGVETRVGFALEGCALCRRQG